MNKIFILLCVCLILLTGTSFAIVRTEEINEWTRDSLGAYYNKYKIKYDRKLDYQKLIDTANSYKDSVTANAQIFGSHVDNIVSKFTNSFDKHSHLTKNDVDGFTTDLKHKLRQLELKGLLTKNHVDEVLDDAHHRAVRQKIMTEDEWKKAYQLFESSYQPPSWYQRVLGLKPNQDSISSSSFNKWVQTVSDRLSLQGHFSKEQTKSIVDHVRQSIIDSKDLHKLGTPEWVRQLQDNIAASTELKKEQLHDILQSITDDVNGYKIFALDYTGQAKAQAVHWCDKVKNQIHNWHDDILSFYDKMYFRLQIKLRELQRYAFNLLNRTKKQTQQSIQDVEKKASKQKDALESVVSKQKASIQSAASSHKASAESVASYASKKWEASAKSIARSRSIHSAASKASSAVAHATDKVKNVDDLKDTFAHFWKHKEHDAYRRLGYTEAQIDWIQNYLAKTFKNQKTLVKGKTDEAAIAIKRYLDSLKVQNPAQVETNVHKLKRHLESWRTLVQ